MPEQLLVCNGKYVAIYSTGKWVIRLFARVSYTMLKLVHWNSFHMRFWMGLTMVLKLLCALCTAVYSTLCAVHSLCINRNYSKCSTKIDLFAGDIFWISSQVYLANADRKLVGSVWFLFLLFIQMNWKWKRIACKIDSDGW